MGLCCVLGSSRTLSVGLSIAPCAQGDTVTRSGCLSFTKTTAQALCFWIGDDWSPFVSSRLGQRLDPQTGQSQPLLNHEPGSPVVCRGCPNRSEVISTCSTCADYSQWPTSCIADRSSGNAIGPLQRLDVVAPPQTTLSKASIAFSLAPCALVLVDTPLEEALAL